MANQLSFAPGIITLVPDGESVYQLSTQKFPNGVFLTAVKFFPESPGACLIVRNHDETGTIISKVKSSSGDMVKDPLTNGNALFPCVNTAEQGWTNPTENLIIFEYQEVCNK